MRIIFVDVDGVLNGYNKWNTLAIKISKKLHIPSKYMRRWLEVFEVKRTYVKRLSKIVKKTDAKLVMSSTWRIFYFKYPYEKMDRSNKRLYELLSKYNLEFIGSTPIHSNGHRESEINEWLNSTDLKVENFVVLDDCPFELQSFIGKHLVQTSDIPSDCMIRGADYENTGLKRKHVKQAIKILKGEHND